MKWVAQILFVTILLCSCSKGEHTNVQQFTKSSEITPFSNSEIDSRTKNHHSDITMPNGINDNTPKSGTISEETYYLHTRMDYQCIPFIRNHYDFEAFVTTDPQGVGLPVSVDQISMAWILGLSHDQQKCNNASDCTKTVDELARMCKSTACVTAGGSNKGLTANVAPVCAVVTTHPLW